MWEDGGVSDVNKCLKELQETCFLEYRAKFSISRSQNPKLIALLNLSVLGFLLVFHDKAKRTQQGNLLHGDMMLLTVSVDLVHNVLSERNLLESFHHFLSRGLFSY